MFLWWIYTYFQQISSFCNTERKSEEGGRGLREDRRRHSSGIPCSVQQAAVTDMLEPALGNKGVFVHWLFTRDACEFIFLCLAGRGSHTLPQVAVGAASDPRSDGAGAPSGCRGAGAAASGGSATPLQGPARPGPPAAPYMGMAAARLGPGRGGRWSRAAAQLGAARPGGFRQTKNGAGYQIRKWEPEDFRIGAGEVAARRSERGRGKGGDWGCELVCILLRSPAGGAEELQLYSSYFLMFLKARYRPCLWRRGPWQPPCSAAQR